MLPLARALSLSQAEVNDLVETTGGDEEEQLRRITDMWKTKAENNELPGILTIPYTASVHHDKCNIWCDTQLGATILLRSTLVL